MIVLLIVIVIIIIVTTFINNYDLSRFLHEDNGVHEHLQWTAHVHAEILFSKGIITVIIIITITIIINCVTNYVYPRVPRLTSWPA